MVSAPNVDARPALSVRRFRDQALTSPVAGVAVSNSTLPVEARRRASFSVPDSTGNFRKIEDGKWNSETAGSVVAERDPGSTACFCK